MPEQRIEAVNMYRNGLSSLKIAKLFDVCSGSIRGLLIRRGIILRKSRTRILRVWTPELWNEGWLDNKGRFRVYRPDCPRAFKAGYALRAHVVWWLANGKCHAKNLDLHHVDENRSNDAIENLRAVTKSEHRHIHQPKNLNTRICAHCGSVFQYQAYRDKDRITRFCSQSCYHSQPRKTAHRKAIGRGLKLSYQEGRR